MATTYTFESAPEHNAAQDMAITAAGSRLWDHVSRPLSEHTFVPLAAYNRTVALAALNVSLTAPRLVEPLLGRWYDAGVESGDKLQASVALGVSALLAASDGLDGAVARQSGLSSEFGAGFDPFVDLIGSYSIAQQVKRRADADGDRLTANLITARLIVDCLAIAAGGIANTAATKYAQNRGVDVDAAHLPKSNAASKLRYALGIVGTTAIRASYILPGRYARPLKRLGQGILLASIPVGLKGIANYSRTAVSTYMHGLAVSSPITPVINNNRPPRHNRV